MTIPGFLTENAVVFSTAVSFVGVVTELSGQCGILHVQ